MTGFGAPPPTSVETGALRQIDSSSKTFVNKDFVKNMAWLNQSVDTLSAYTQKLQAGVDSANQNVIEQIQGVLADIFVLIAGGEPTGIDLGDFRYVLQALGAMFGINPNTPFPLNIAEAVWHMIRQFVIPNPQFTDVIFDAIIAWAESLGFSEEAVDAIEEFNDAVIDLYFGIEETFDIIGDIFTSILKAFGVGTGGVNLSGLQGFWTAITGFMDNILEGPHELLMNILSNIVVFIFKSLTWLTRLINPQNLLDSTGMRFIGPQLVPNVSSSTVDWSVGSNINTGWVFDDTVTHANSDQINSGINTGWWTVPHYTTDTSLGSFKTIGNGVAKRVLTQEILPCTPGQSYYLSGYIKANSIPTSEDTVGPCVVFYYGASEVSQTNVNLSQGHGSTFDWTKNGQIIVVPNNVDGFKIGSRITASFNSGTVWIDDISYTGEQSRGAGIAQGILDFPRNLVSGIIDYIDGIVTFFFGENNILSKVLASIIPGLDATVITTGKFAQEMIQGLDAAIQSIWDGINGVITDLGQLIHDLWYDPIGTIGQIGQNMVDGLTTALSNLGTGISDLVSDLGQLLYDLWNNPAQVIANLIAAMIPGLDASKIVSGELAQEMVTGLTTALTDLGTGINNALTNLGQLMYDLWHNPIEVLSNLAAVMIPGLDASKIISGQYAMEMVDGLGDALSNLGNWVQDVIDAVIGAITGIPIIGGVVQGIIDGIEGLFDGLFGQPTPAATLAAQAVPAIDASKIQSGVLDVTIVPDLDGAKITTGTVVANRIAALDASKIQSGTFGTTRIADSAITDAKVSDLSGTKINTGTVAADYVGALDASKIQSGQFQNAQIATGLDAAKLTTGTLPIDRVANNAITNAKISTGVDAGKLTTGTLPIARVADNAITNAKINDLSGSKINAGSVAADYVGALDASKIQSGQFQNAQIATGLDAAKLTTGTLPIDRVANNAITNAKISTGVDAGKLTTGTLPIDRVANNAITNAKINDLSGSKINAGSVAADYIAALDASKIQFGIIDPTRLPSDLTTVGSGLICLKTSGSYTTLFNSSGNTLPTGFYNKTPSNTSDLQIVSEYIDDDYRVGCKALNAGWYMVEIGYQLRGGGDFIKFSYSWNLTPILWLKSSRSGDFYYPAIYKWGDSNGFTCWLGGFPGPYGWGADFSQTSFIIYLYENDVIYPGYFWSRTDTNVNSDTVIKATTSSPGCGTYFGVSLLNRSLA